MSFAEKLKNLALTENDARALKSTLNTALDLFYTIGASRGKDILPLFSLSFQEFPNLSLRIALWARDISACGERQIFRDILKYIESQDIELFKKIAMKVSSIGRWDDLLCAQTVEGFEFVSQLIKRDIEESNKSGDNRSLAAKWMPRKGGIANKLRKAFKMTPKDYRKFLVENTKVVESKMCENKFDEIDFNQVPSLAMARYTNAFKRKAEKSYEKYKEDLSSNKLQAKTNSLYPYDVLKTLKNGDEQMAELQWRDLPDFIAECNVLPLVDVSGSMVQYIGTSTTAIDVSISMGIYIAEKQKGDFKNLLLTFETKPSFVDLSKLKTLKEKYDKTLQAPWGGSTNLKAAFSEILNLAIKYKIPQNEMPEILMIFSDMEFDSACSDKSNTVYETCEEMFKEKGYELPIVVFWNLVSRNKHMPVQFDTNGTLLLSGLSPFIIKDVLKDLKNLNSVELMLKVVSNSKYDF